MLVLIIDVYFNPCDFLEKLSDVVQAKRRSGNAVYGGRWYVAGSSWNPANR